ncbi:MAG: bacteriohemerythrin [Magnetococcales bacterium]|nr:bacteriohemerythrin [Magnetococcales bacterium]
MSKINKLRIIDGVEWVEIADVDLRLLCGCPGDVVKHIMRRGLIATTEKNGVSYETGPNAILLSDIMLQGGGFSNLSEFPVLQMFYRQGMIIPNHPNNTGQKPILIGSRQQIEAQIRYIYRGNYGLVSEREIREAGVSESWAKDLMRMKLFFAFGQIRPTDTLLDVRYVEQVGVEIYSGVWLERLETNRFKISYAGESVTVDLNLKKSESYPSPYPLNYYSLPRDYFSVIHSGIGDGWDFDRPSLSSVIVYQGGIYLVDAGPNVVNNLVALGIGINEIEGIFHTHSHDDHFAGLADLIRGDRRIKYFSTALVRAAVTKKLAALLDFDEDYFSDFFEVHDLESGVWNSVNGLEVKPIHSPHPVENAMFFFRTLWEGGYLSYAHFADITSQSVMEKMVTEDETKPGMSPGDYKSIVRDYLTPADLKKIDVGGGMIHGEAEDFKGDRSHKIILGHLSRPLNHSEKKVGSGAPFGAYDTLIPDNQNYFLRCAREFLTSNFANAQPHQYNTLLNNPIESFHPEEIILKEGVIPRSIFLVLSGNVEALIASSDSNNTLYAGSILGEMSGIDSRPSGVTYRAMSYVNVLRIPCNLFVEFIKKNNLYERLERVQKQREFLKSSWLFGEGVSYLTQNRIARSMELRTFSAGDEIRQDEKSPSIYFVLSGCVERFIGKKVLESIGPQNIFGESRLLFGASDLFRLRVSTSLSAYKIPHESIRNVPIIRWKLLESYNKKSREWFESVAGKDYLFQWNEEYSIEIEEMDDQHKRMFEMAHKVLQAFSLGDQTVGERALSLLVDFTQQHFEQEEALLDEYGFPEAKQHKKNHKRLLGKIKQIQKEMAGRGKRGHINLEKVMKEWVLIHILTEDRKFGQFVRQQTETLDCDAVER